MQARRSPRSTNALTFRVEPGILQTISWGAVVVALFLRRGTALQRETDELM